MQAKRYIKFLNIIEKLKCNTRHSWTSSGRQESVAEHSWRLAVMAMLCEDEYPNLDIDRVIKMCLVHDLGEALTGDIPAFLKTSQDDCREERAVASLLSLLPTKMEAELVALFDEMKEIKTSEARLYKALDNIEAVISHNEAPISTWLPREYEENLTYGNENVTWSPWTQALREAVRQESVDKINQENK